MSELYSRRQVDGSSGSGVRQGSGGGVNWDWAFQLGWRLRVGCVCQVAQMGRRRWFLMQALAGAAAELRCSDVVDDELGCGLLLGWKRGANSAERSVL